MFTFQTSYSEISLENKKCCLNLVCLFQLLRDFPTNVNFALSKSRIFSFSKDIFEFVTWECQIAHRLGLRSLLKFIGATFLIKFFQIKIFSFWGMVHISCKGISHNFENEAYFLKIGENLV